MDGCLKDPAYQRSIDSLMKERNFLMNKLQFILGLPVNRCIVFSLYQLNLLLNLAVDGMYCGC